MFAFLKAIVLGAILSGVISAVVGHAGGTGGAASVHHFVIEGFGFYWSWVLFVGGTLLAFAIFMMLE
jgi:hypothetical protein|uniref:hypothetical protein n=1 Tax=Altererythrobacter segetis TaxID=1104773 RepID=UPI0014096403|nr:hypothetical protein [Altererythrobacter segetis]